MLFPLGEIADAPGLRLTDRRDVVHRDVGDVGVGAPPAGVGVLGALATEVARTFQRLERLGDGRLPLLDLLRDLLDGDGGAVRQGQQADQQADGGQ